MLYQSKSTRLKPEEREQCALMQWAHLHNDIWPYLIHIRNEGKRSLAEGARAKRMGLMKGVSDLFLAKPKVTPDGWNNDGHAEYLYSGGFWIELKSQKGKPSKEQLDFLRKMEIEGYETGIFYSWTEAANAILQYIGEPKQF